MKYGIREICEVVLKAKSNRKIGNKMFYKGEPVIYFDSLKTSTLEGATTTVYATGGRGNARLMAWEGERTVTFTMEDALISPMGLMILTGAGLVADSEVAPVHTVESTSKVIKGDDNRIYIELTDTPVSAYKQGGGVYVMIKDGDDLKTEPYLALTNGDITKLSQDIQQDINQRLQEHSLNEYHTVVITTYDGYVPDHTQFVGGDSVLVDYYVNKPTGSVQQIEITPDSFGGNFYLEASTLFRATSGEDHPAEFIIPNCKVQSNFSFALAATGDPSTFTFTMDAFPDYTRFNPNKKVICAMQVIDPQLEYEGQSREKTAHDFTV